VIKYEIKYDPYKTAQKTMMINKFWSIILRMWHGSCWRLTALHGTRLFLQYLREYTVTVIKLHQMPDQ